MIRGLIFDFDGLILDTEGPVYQSWRELYARFGQTLPLGEWGEVIGRSANEHFDPFERLEARLGRALEREALSAWRLQRELALVENQPLLPGVAARLEEARQLGLKLAVASSSPRTWVEGHLRRLGLRAFFDVVHTSDDVDRTKPDPQLFLLALDSLGLLPSEAIVFEDSPHGVTAARAAGVFCVAVPNPLTRQLPLDHADLRLESLADTTIAALLAGLQL